MALCPKCGFNNDKNAKFCEKCGESLQDNVSNPKTKKSVIIIGLGFILITGTSIGVFLFNDIFSPLKSNALNQTNNTTSIITNNLSTNPSTNNVNISTNQTTPTPKK